MRVLFWNTHKNPDINPILEEIIYENRISLVVLAEYSADLSLLLEDLHTDGVSMVPYMSVGCDRITLLGNVRGVSPAVQSHYMSMQIIRNNTILCCVHLPSNIYSDAESRQNIVIGTIISDIRRKEQEIQTNNTIIVGDFNMNPYSRNCICADRFHGLPVYNDAKRISRTIAGTEFYMFYNPMWKFFGDETTPSGTYYYDGSTTDNIYWHIYDQVMIRPSLKDRFVDSSLKIITQTASYSLLDCNGHPDQHISDHLPIVFEILEG